MSEPEHPAVSLEIQRIQEALAAPFGPDQIQYKPQTMGKNGTALAVAYIDARDVQERLDAVVGVDGWQDTYDFLPNGCVVCTLSLRIAGEWLSKVDVGGPPEQRGNKPPDVGDQTKATVSDALKRAAVKWGIGRHLYDEEPQWLPYDGKKFTQKPRQQPARPATPAPVRTNGSDRGDRLLTRIRARDEELSRAGQLPARGFLLAEVSRVGQIRGWPAEINRWPMPEGIEVATEVVNAYPQVARAHVLNNLMRDLKLSWREVVSACPGIEAEAQIEALPLDWWEEARAMLMAEKEHRQGKKQPA